MWHILETIFCALENRKYSAAIIWTFMYISVGFICSIVLFKTAVPLLIFYLDDLSIIENRVLKSPSITVFLPISPLISAIFFLYLGALMMSSYIFIIYISLLN